MRKHEALDLISQYCGVLSLTCHPGVDEALKGLHSRWQDGSEAKAMRWLGFMQGGLFALGVYSLDELKEHSRTRRVPLPTHQESKVEL